MKQSQQKGISLFIALIALAIMSLAAVGLIRTMDTGVVAIGNIGFQQVATRAADRGIEQAINWLNTNKATNSCSGGPTLNCNSETNGYYASYGGDTLDPTGSKDSDKTRTLIDWKGNDCADEGSYASCLTPSNAISIDGQEIRYFITRLCRLSGSTSGSGNACVWSTSGAADESSKRGELRYDERRFTSSLSPNYRIIVYVRGTRNTVSVTETLMHF
ncbi:MAG: pilus assembly PilX family protein [Shewanella sp.]|jgi:type IV pilus assembly protein PilX